MKIRTQDEDDNCILYTGTINKPHLPIKLGLDVMHCMEHVSANTSCAGVIGRWGLLFHAQNAVGWLALSKRSVEAL